MIKESYLFTYTVLITIQTKKVNKIIYEKMMIGVVLTSKKKTKENNFVIDSDSNVGRIKVMSGT